MTHRRNRTGSVLHGGSEYSDEERLFLIAIDRYKRKVSLYPTWLEVFDIARDVLRSVGWSDPSTKPRNGPMANKEKP